MKLDAATVMLQWASGGMLFLWFTLRSGEISVGYAKLLRGVYAALALVGAGLGFTFGAIVGREVASIVLAVLAVATFARRDNRIDAVAAGIGFVGVVIAALGTDHPDDALWLARLVVGAVFLGAVSDAMLLGHWYLVQPGMPRKLLNELTNVLLVVWLFEIAVFLVPTGMLSVLNGAIVGREAASIVLAVLAVVTFARRDNRIDAVAAGIGFVGVLIAALGTDHPDDALWLVRLVVGAVFLGAVSDAMLLGHWYLVQPGMPRKLLNELTNVLIVVWLVEIAVFLVPTGMLSVLNGTIDDGWNGVLGWFWLACAASTGVLAWFTRAALRERSYSAVMAATGLSYLAILTGFGTDLIARALLMA